MFARKSKLWLTFAMAVIACLLWGQAVSACTSIPVTPGASADGSAMTTHTDDSGTDTFLMNVVPAKDWKPGSMRKVLRRTDYGPRARSRTA